MLVFIHGGDFFNGANFIYPGYFQASYGVVTVTVNYRLNILGKQTLTANTSSCNMAIRFNFSKKSLCVINFA